MIFGAFRGTDRYQPTRQLGEGGMGVVYQARDVRRGVDVALKTLHHLSADGLLRFKREFRALRDVSHPNLVRLGELVEHQGVWFYTMELVDGVPLSDLASERAAAPTEPFDDRRVRSVLAQIAGALAMLHAHGKVHRDVKPSNILVTDSGRAVLLDFGLVLDSASGHATRSVVGTAEYMAPEQASGGEIGPAADWYALGAILYELLTGRVPIAGASAVEVMTAKQDVDPVSPDALVAGLPADLVALAVELLARDPAARPREAEILARLGVEGTDPRFDWRRVACLGRDDDLEAFATALARVRAGCAGALLFLGEPGIGRSTVLAAGLDALSDAATVVRTRCFASDSLPFNAVDGLVDGLTEVLRALLPEQLPEALPAGMDLLARVFPVLRKVEAVARGAGQGGPERPQAERSALAEALRGLIEALARDRPMVLAIDDLQWADADSLGLLESLFAAPQPRVLVVGTLRLDDDPFEWLVRWDEALAGGGGQLWCRTLEALPKSAAIELALRARGDGSRSRARSLAQACQGHPQLIVELARSSVVAGDGGEGGNLVARLADVIAGQLAALDEDARTLALLVATGEPVAREHVTAAAGIGASRVAAALAALEHARLVRADDRDVLRLSSDRMRDVVGRAMDDDRRRELARALLAVVRSSAAPEVVARLAETAGERGEAAHAYVTAARDADRVLAYERAAAHYTRALALVPDDPAVTDWRRARAESLASAGRAADAARAYAAAARGTDPALLARAAEHYLRGGYIDEGLAVFSQVFAAYGIRMPRTAGQAVRDLLWQRARLRLRWRGLEASGQARPDPARAPDAGRPGILSDLYWSIAMGLSMVDFVRAADFQARSVRLALVDGEPRRVARALLAEAAFAGSSGDDRRAAALLERGEALVDGEPYLQAFTHAVRGVGAINCGQWRDGHRWCREAELMFRDRCRGVGWEIALMQQFIKIAQLHTCELRALHRDVVTQLRLAVERGDRFAANSLRSGFATLSWLARDRADIARAQLVRAVAEWSQAGFYSQHWHHLHGRASIDLYEGRDDEAYEEVRRRWPAIEAAHLLRVRGIRVDAYHLRGRVAAALWRRHGGRAERSDALRCADELARVGGPWPGALAALVRAAAADRDSARDELLARAKDLAAEAGSVWIEKCARWAAARFRGDRAALMALESWAGRVGIERLDAYARIMVPAAAVEVDGQMSLESGELRDPFVLVELRGHLSVAALHEELTALEQAIAGGPVRIIFDASAMTGYDIAARARFTSWHAAHRHRLARVAVVTERASWRAIVATMAVVARSPLRAFATLDEAAEWMR